MFLFFFMSASAVWCILVHGLGSLQNQPATSPPVFGASSPRRKPRSVPSAQAAQIFGGLSYSRGGQGEKVERLNREVRAMAIPGGSEAGGPPLREGWFQARAGNPAQGHGGFGGLELFKVQVGAWNEVDVEEAEVRRRSSERREMVEE